MSQNFTHFRIFIWNSFKVVNKAHGLRWFTNVNAYNFFNNYKLNTENGFLDMENTKYVCYNDKLCPHCAYNTFFYNH